MFVGSGTGAVVAFALSQGKKPSECIKIMEGLSTNVFANSWLIPSVFRMLANVRMPSLLQ